MAIFRVTFGFAGGNQGWTETHMANIAATTALAAQTPIQAVAAARAAMLCREFKLNGVRTSIYSDGATPAVRLPRNTWLDKNNYGSGGNTVAWAGEPNPVSLQAIGIAGTLGVPVKLQGNKNTTYLGGPTDTMVTNNGQVVKAANNLLGLFNAWKQVMIQSNFGWGAVQPLVSSDIASATQNDDATVTFVVTPPVDASLVVGTTYPIRVSRINGGRSPLNRALNAKYTAANTFKTIEQIAFALDQQGGKLVPYVPVLLFIPYANIALGDATIEHKRGRPFLSEPGRARKEIRA